MPMERNLKPYQIFCYLILHFCLFISFMYEKERTCTYSRWMIICMKECIFNHAWKVVDMENIMQGLAFNVQNNKIIWCMTKYSQDCENFMTILHNLLTNKICIVFHIEDMIMIRVLNGFSNENHERKFICQMGGDIKYIFIILESSNHLHAFSNFIYMNFMNSKLCGLIFKFWAITLKRMNLQLRWKI